VGSFDAERDYIKVIKRLSRLCKPSTDVIATLNSPYLGPDHLPHLMQRYQPRFRLLGDFPVSPEFKDKYPERALKIHHFKSPS
jgi:23S rRNA (cytosine1962-C5)-methyltransferase